MTTKQIPYGSTQTDHVPPPDPFHEQKVEENMSDEDLEELCAIQNAIGEIARSKD